MIPWVKILLLSLTDRYVERSSLEFRFFKNAFWTLLSSTISRLLTLGSLLVTARILGQSEYGALGMIRSTTMAFAAFAGLGVGLTATKFVAEYRNSLPEKVENIIGLTYGIAIVSGLFFLVIFFIGSDVIALDIMNRPELSSEVKIGSFILFFSTMVGAQTGIASGLESFKTITITNLLAGLISLPIIVAAAYWFGIKGAVIGLCINQLLLFILLHVMLGKLLKETKISFSLSFSRITEEFALLWKFTMPAFLATLTPVAVLWIANTWIIKRPDGFNELAVIDVANQWKEIIMYLPAILSTSILPILSSSSLNEHTKHFNKVMRLYFLVMLVLSLCLVLPVGLFANKILLLYGFQPTSTDQWVLILYSISTIFLIVSSGLGQMLISRNKMWQGFFLNLAWGVINLSLTAYFLSMNYGSFGLALAFFISYGIYAAAMYIYSARNLKLKSTL